MSTRLLKNILCIWCLACPLSLIAQTPINTPDPLNAPLKSLRAFFETTSSISFKRKIHQKILHSGDVTRDDHYLIKTTLSKKPRGLYHEVSLEGEPARKIYWNGGKKMWFHELKNKVAFFAKIKGKPTSSMYILHKMSLNGIDRFIPNGLSLWETLFFEKDLTKQFDQLKEYAEYLGEETIDSKNCWVIKIPFQLGNPTPPSEEYATHIFSKLWIRKADGALIRCTFDQVASSGVWQMHNNIAADFLDLQLDTTIDPSTFDFKLSDNITLITSKPELLPVGSKAPNFELIDLEGKRTNLYDYKDDIMIVSFTAVTCSNCRALYPHLQKIQNEYADQVTLLPIYCEDKTGTIKNYFEKKNLSLSPLRVGFHVPHYLYNVYGTPTTYIIDRNKNIIKVIVSYPNDATADNAPEEYDIYKYVESLLKKQ